MKRAGEKGCGKLELQVKRALARLLEAHEDLKAAKLLLRKVESRSLFHSQQAVEKSLKACLSKVIIGDIKLHPVIKLLKEKVLPSLPEPLQEQFTKLEDDAFWVERRWIDTRYEEIGANGKILTPLFRFGKTDARSGINAAEGMVFWATDSINELFSRQLPKSYRKLRKIVEKELQ